jgi:hypothetical protein
MTAFNGVHTTMKTHDSAAEVGAGDAKSGNAPASLPASTPSVIRDAYLASYEWAKKN